MNRKQGILGLLAGKTKKVATVEEMNEAAAAGWAGEEGGGNVYADLGYLDAAAMLDKARRVVRIAVAIEARQWSPEQAAAALDMTPLKLRELLAGRFRTYSVEDLERLALSIEGGA
jgi:hypothetical protein